MRTLVVLACALAFVSTAAASTRSLPAYGYVFSSYYSCADVPCHLVLTPHGIGPGASVTSTGASLLCSSPYIYWHWRDGLTNCSTSSFPYDDVGSITLDSVSGPWVWDAYAEQYVPTLGWRYSALRTITLGGTYPVYAGMFAVGGE